MSKYAFPAKILLKSDPLGGRTDRAMDAKSFRTCEKRCSQHETTQNGRTRNFYFVVSIYPDVWVKNIRGYSTTTQNKTVK